MEAKLNALSKLDLRSLCSKKLLGIPIDSVISGKRTQFSKKELISKILEKGDITIQSAIDKRNKAPIEYLADEPNVSDDERTKSPIKELLKKATEREQAKLKKLADDKGDEATTSFGKQYFTKFKKEIDYKKMTKKQLVEFMDELDESKKAISNEQFVEMRDIAINKYDDEGKIRISDNEGKNRTYNEKEEKANIRRIIRQKQDETPAQKGDAPKPQRTNILPETPDEFEQEKAQEDQFKKITRKNVGKINLAVKVEDDNVKVKPNVKISDIKKAIQKNSSRLKLSKPPKIVYHSLKNMGKTALLTI